MRLSKGQWSGKPGGVQEAVVRLNTESDGDERTEIDAGLKGRGE